MTLRATRTAVGAALATILLLALPRLGVAQDIDLTGEWVLTVESPNGTGTRAAVFEQHGDTLTGTISSSMAAGTVQGTVAGDVITFTAVLTMDSGPFEVVYRATYADDRLVDGTVGYGDYGAGTFTGRRKAPGGPGGFTGSPGELRAQPPT